MVAIHQYKKGGVFLVTLDVRALGAASTKTKTVTIAPAAPPTISVSPNPAIEDEAATFTATAQAVPGVVIEKYTWKWGDGSADTVSTSGVQTHTYATVGAFNVTVDVEDSLGGTSQGLLGITVVAKTP
jgi:PKD repeat protein